MTAPVPAAWAWWPFRIVITAATVLLVNQAIYAGQFLSGSYEALPAHRENATVAGIAVAVAALAAVLIRWPGRGPLWPSLVTLGVFALVAAQITVGFARVLTVHIPLGVTIILAAVALTVWAWRARPPTQRDAPDPTSARSRAGR